MLEYQEFLYSQLVSRGVPYAPNARYGLVVDFSVDSNKNRLFLFDIKTKELIYSGFTSHGSGSGKYDHAYYFSNEPGSLKSSKGVLLTAETFISNKHGYACRLDGQEKGVNDNVRVRGIILHEADYVDNDYVAHNEYPGRSWGCITLAKESFKHIIDLVKGGSPVVIITDEDVDKS